MFSCCGSVSTHTRKEKYLEALGFQNKNGTLDYCVSEIDKIEDAGKIREYIGFLFNCISGKIISFDICGKNELERHIYALTGNTSNNIFARQIITKSATILLFFLCDKYSQLADVIGCNSKPIISSDYNASINDKCRFINNILSFSKELKSLDSIDLIRGNINKDYLIPIAI